MSASDAMLPLAAVLQPAELTPGRPVAAGAAWAGLLASGLAAVAGGLSSQVHGLAGADLGGAFGLSADEASWINTAGSMAEGAAVLAVGPLLAAFGGRRLLLWGLAATGALGLASSGWATPDTAVPLRFAQGFACGLLPVVMMNWAMRAFPPPRRALALMLFALASSAPAAVAASVAGAFTVHFGGRGAAMFDVLWTPALFLVVLVFMPREPAAPDRLRGVDWTGFALLSAAVMLVLLALTQGERRFWLETPWFAPVLAAAAVLFAAALIWLLIAPRPFVDLALLLKPTFAAGMAGALSLRFGVLMASYAVPQTLARLHGFRAEQAGGAVLWLGAGQLVGFPLAWAWGRWGDARWCLAAGLALFAGAALMASTVDAGWECEQFRPLLLAAGAGQGLFLTSVLAFATMGIGPAAGETAAALFNLTRVLGTAGATAAVGALLRLREADHSARLVEGVTGGNAAAAEGFAALSRTYASLTADGGLIDGSALAGLARGVQVQAYALAFSDVFLGIAAAIAIVAVLVPLLPRLPPLPPTSAGVPAPILPEHRP